MLIKLFPFIAFIFLVACGDDSLSTSQDINEDSSTTSDPNNKSMTEKSKLYAYMSESHVCDVLNQQKLIEAFNIKSEIKTRPNETNGNYSCYYFWELPMDVLKSRQQQMSQVMRSENPDKSLMKRLRYASGEVSVSLINSNQNAENFNPMTPDVKELKEHQGVGVFNTLTNGLEVFITTMIADKQEQDDENAKKIYRFLNH